MPIEVKEGFLLLHKRGGVPVLVKGNAILALEPFEGKGNQGDLGSNPPMVNIMCSNLNITVLETHGEIIEAITLSYKQVTRK